VRGLHAATSKVENSTQGSSCKLKFVNASSLIEQHRGGGAISKVESARVILAPNGAVLLRGGSGLNNLLYYFLRRK
jgi:hypothetical protein